MPKRHALQTRDHHRVKLPLVYLLSTGRSGSTLLDVLLGAQPECWTLGEFQLLDIGVGRQLPCGCRDPIGQCDFWEPILERVRRSIRFPLGHFRSGRHPNGKVVRWSLLPSILTGGPLPTQQAAADAYAVSNLRALEEAKEAAEEHQDEVAWLIDASKDPYRLLWLQASGHFDIRVIHLIRRPEGFVANMMRSADVRGAAAAIKYAGRWLVDNLIGLALVWRMFWPEAVKRVRYEDLASDPERTLGEICSWLGVSFDTDRTKATRYVVNHGIAGNQPRWEALPVTFEENWRATMPPLQQRLISLMTAPLKSLWASDRAEAAAWNPNAVHARRRALPPWMTRSSSGS
ncbi:MAG: sulfotransferase [Alphaproteobacteria bacterium]|nr:sulfotransferase [Alphaproteobacteria bacterium]